MEVYEHKELVRIKENVHECAEFLYHTPSDLERLGGLWVIRAGQTRTKPSYHVGPKIIECFSLHWVISGDVALTYNGQTVRLRTGDMFCLFPGIRYSYQIADSESQLRMYWLAFNGNQAGPFLKRIGITPERPYLPGKMSPETEQLILHIHAVLRSKGMEEELRLQSLLYQLFEMMSYQHVRPTIVHGEANWLERCVQYMNTHYMEGITVADVVEVAGVHRSHVYNECIQLLGMSPLQYLIKLRMEHGVEMLREGDLSITDISLSLGYPDLFSFSRAFCKYYGMPPTQYQAALK